MFLRIKHNKSKYAKIDYQKHRIVRILYFYLNSARFLWVPFFFSSVASSHSWLLLASGHSNSQVFSSTYCYLPHSHYILNFGFKERTLKLVLFKFRFNRDDHLCIYSHIYSTLFQKKLADTSLLGQCQFGTCFII